VVTDVRSLDDGFCAWMHRISARKKCDCGDSFPLVEKISNFLYDDSSSFCLVACPSQSHPRTTRDTRIRSSKVLSKNQSLLPCRPWYCFYVTKNRQRFKSSSRTGTGANLKLLLPSCLQYCTISKASEELEYE
jgi:hypothetical protein